MSEFAPEYDVNTEEGFQASIAAKTGRSQEEIADLAPPSETPNVLSGLTTDETPKAPERDPDTGRFTKAEEPETPELPVEIPEDEDEDEPPAPAAEESPALAELRRQNEELQKVLGRQGQELGELRKQLEADDEEDWEPTPLPGLAGLDDKSATWVEERIASQGVDATLAWIGQNRPDLFEGALEVASDPEIGNPVAAARWAVRYEMAMAQQAAPATPDPTAATPDPYVQQLKMQNRATEQVQEVAKLLGEDFTTVKPHVLEAFKESPQAIQQLVLSEDEGERAQGAQALAALSRARALTGATAAAKQAERDRQVATKQAAQVATGSQRPVTPERQPGALGSEDERAAAVARFKAELMGTETTSVADGLTYG